MGTTVPQSEPQLILDTVRCREAFDSVVLEIRITVNDEVLKHLTPILEKDHLQVNIRWKAGGIDKNQDYALPVQNGLEATFCFELPPGGTGTLEASTKLPNGQKLSASATLPVRTEYNAMLKERVSEGKPVRTGERFQIGGEQIILFKDLIIEPGGVVEFTQATSTFFGPDVGIYCEGTLVMKGSFKSPVGFYSYEESQPWAGIVLSGPFARSSMFENAVIMGAGGFKWALNKKGFFVPSKEDNASGMGGGLAIVNTGWRKSGAPIVIAGTNISECESERGGGMAIYNSDVTLVGTRMKKNKAGKIGGGLYANHSKIVMINGNWSENEAGIAGGAMALVNGTTVSVELAPKKEGDQFLEKNKALKGADVFSVGSDVLPETAGKFDQLQISKTK